MAALQEIRDALEAFSGDPARVGSLASTLGFTPTPLPRDLLAERTTALAQAFESPKVTDRFGVQELYRVADGPATGSALYLAVLGDWGDRSSSRDRARRRVARAVVRNTQDLRSLILLVPNALERANRGEIEVVMPRLRERGGKSDISTIRALVSTSDPSRFHVDLLQSLAVSSGMALTAITSQWRKAFSVERVTREFYQAYAGVRDTIVKALVAENPGHPWVIQTTTSEDGDARRREWATRQLGRVLFLWFLQSKRWLGYDGGGVGSPTYLLDLWNRRGESGQTLWSGMLRPLFFEGMAQARPSAEVRTLLGDVPFLNGGLFRYSSLEDDVEELGGALDLPDEVFNPAVAEGQPHTVFSLLQRYRFTTRESTPDDQSVDPDPELLGRVFENLYQGDERHDSGTYYTPREIVHFMCRQALDGYLRDATGVDQETLNWLRHEVTDPEDSDRVLATDRRERIEEALERVRICDPAVGSGAFLLGAMQEMVRLRKGMAHAAGEDDAQIDEHVEEWKRRAIEHSLYGVDINPEAVEICQLRLWLSLVLDYQGHPREVRPLPNLDFRIRVGDSLIDRFEEVAFVESRPAGSYQAPFELVGKLDGEHEKIEQWLAEYEHAAPARQRDIRGLIQKAKLRVLKAQVTAQRDEAASKVSSSPAQSAAARTRQARAAKKAAQDLAGYEEALVALDDIEAQRPRVEKPFLWPLAFPEVFEDGGFDLVLANPPYVRGSSVSLEDKRVFAKAYPRVFTKDPDLYVYFFERAIQILRKDGWFSFITPHKFMRSDYGAGLRQLLVESCQIEDLIDFGHLAVFEADVNPLVLVARRGTTQGTVRFARLREPIRQSILLGGQRVNIESVREEIEDLPELLAAHGRLCMVDGLAKSHWAFLTAAEAALYSRLAARSRSFQEAAGPDTYRGVLTGLNDAFVLSGAQRSDILSRDPTADAYIRPWVRGQDVRRWTSLTADRWIICAPHGEQVVRSPGVREHLEQFRHPVINNGRVDRGGLEPLGERGCRKRSSHHWYAWQDSTAYFSHFIKQKLVWKDLSYLPQFAWDESSAVCANSTFFSSSAPKWLAAYANSALFTWAAWHRLFEAKDAFQRWWPTDLADLPVPLFPSEVERELAELVDRLILATDETESAALQRHVDVLVFDAIEATDEERAVIDAWLEQRRRSETAGSILAAHD